MFKFSDKSIEKLNTCHDDLVMVMMAALQASHMDFGIAEGFRSIERQKEMYRLGRSKIDGVNIKGKHNKTPSEAVDIYAYVDGKGNYETPNLCYLAGVIMTTAAVLFQAGEIEHTIRWGGNWDMDGTIIADQSFDDLVHFELYKP